MTQLFVALLVLVLVVGRPAARRSQRACREAPALGPWLVAGATVLLIGVAIGVTQLDHAIPDSMRESPAGIFPFFGAALILAILAVAAASAIVGVVLSRRPASGEAES